jgi:hypothetical protein
MNAELLRRGELNITDAAFVRDHFIPAAMKAKRWNIVVYEAFRTVELLIKGIFCLSGNKPDKKNHDVHHLIDKFLTLLEAERNSQPFFYSATSPSGHAYGIYSDGKSIQLMNKVHGIYTSMAAAPREASINELLLLELEVKGSTVSVYCGDKLIFKQTDSTIPDATNFSRSFKCPDPAQLKPLRRTAKQLKKKRTLAFFGEVHFSKRDAEEAVSLMHSALSAAKAFVTF